ncbi:FxSxx-COOH system tetratricopeptide repeat protein [Actinoplanes sp. NPDC026619]|uniref:FxSxx-COOH system tetratricopeptide repeat protein n=1 Tax=Actinoplanes sp. NPDC026619 TaxID=3155798 RepID=UPI003410BFE2
MRVFVSYAGPDRPWAEWAAQQLEAAGFEAELDVWDWSTGDNFVLRMNDALAKAEVMLALFSPAYFARDRFTTDEWAAVLAERPDSPSRRRLIPIRVAEVTPPPLLRPLLFRDVFGVPEEQARQRLLAAVSGPSRPTTTVPFPGGPARPAPADGTRVPGSLPPIWNVRRRNPAFTARERELARLRERLCSGERALVQALHGIGGVGKTELAVEYAHLFGNEYDLVWWIPSERPESIGDHLAALAAAAGVAEIGTPTPVALDAIHRHLRGQARWLLIFDNAESRDDLASWLPSGPGHLIITSRNPAWTGVAEPVSVDLFARRESVALLHTYLPGVGTEDMDRLAEALGDLPLAITQAAELLTGTHLPVDTYLTDLRRNTAGLLREGQPPAGYPMPLGAAVAVAAQRLADEDAAAGQLLALCAHLGPEPIPADLFTARPDLLAGPLGDVAQREVAFGRAIAQLSRFGLARVTSTGPLFHRLTQAVLRDTDLDPDGHRGTVEKLLVAARPQDATAPADWPRWKLLLPHVLARDPAGTENHDLRWLAIEAVNYLHSRGDMRAALPLAEQLHTAWRRRLGPDETIVLAAAGSLAANYRRVDRYQEARDLDDDGLTRRRRLHGEDAAATLATAHNLVVDLSLLGEQQRALRLSKDTLARMRSVLGDDHPHALRAADTVAALLFRTGQIQPALDLSEDTLAKQRQILGVDNPSTLISAASLVALLFAADEYDRAFPLGHDTLTRRRQALGDNHPDTLTSADHLAAVLVGLGRYDEARALAMDTHARLRQVLGDDHPGALSAARRFDDFLRAAEARDRTRGA